VPRLHAIASAAPPAFEDAVADDAGVEPWALTERGRQELAAVRADLDPEPIVRAFPRDDKARLVLSAQALLAPVESTLRLKSGRSVYALVRGPRVRSDGDRLELALGDAIPSNASHAWLVAPWLWRRGARAPDVDDRALACAALLDAGRFDEALAMYGISLSERAIRTLEGMRGSTYAAEDREALRRTLWELAPWSLPRRGWNSLALLSHQTGQVKGWIALREQTIDIDSTARNDRLPEVLWKRPVDFDLRRLGIERVPVAALATRAPSASPKAGKPRPTVTLAEALRGKDWWKATRALELAKRRPRREACDELLAIARGTGPENERAGAVHILGEIARDEDDEALAGFLEDPDETVRRVAIDAVKRRGYRAALPTLARIVTSPQSGRSTLRTHALTAMKSLSGKSGPAGLIGYLDHEDPRVREAACIAFTIFEDGRRMAKEPLEQRLADVDPSVAKAAAQALETLPKS
jgi:hypothetical protein